MFIFIHQLKNKQKQKQKLENNFLEYTLMFPERVC
jgi:hypothetical protein